MKNLFKLSALALVAMFAFAACSSDDDDNKKPVPEPEPEPVVAEDAKLLSFGFYQEDNADVLSKDYVAEVPAVVSGTTTYNIEIPMPSVVDKSALVARFTVTEGNTIAVSGTAQVSQSSKNDFTAPVDYTVSNSDKTQNLRYTVTVTKSTNMAWTEVGVLDAAAITGTAEVSVWSGAVLAVNPKDNVPYVAFRQRGGDDKLTVAKYDNGWATVGATSFTPKVSSSYYDFAIAPDGTPYVAFSDNEPGEGQVSGAVSVMKFSGSSWALVGDKCYSNAKVSNYLGLAALESGVVTSFWNNVKSQTDLYRCIVLSANTGSVWTTEAMPTGTFAAAAMADNGKVAYVWGRQVTATNGESIVKYENGQFTTIADKFVPEGATQVYNAGMNLAVAPDGTLYVLVADDATGGWKPQLRYYDAAQQKFVTVGGGVLPVEMKSYSRSWEFKTAIAPDGTPYVVFNNVDNNDELQLIYLDSDTKQWSSIAKIADAPESTASDLNFSFTSTGVGYLTFTDKQNKVHLLKFAEK